MLPVKTGIPPNNSFFFSRDGTFMKSSAMESQEKLSDLVYRTNSPLGKLRENSGAK